MAIREMKSGVGSSPHPLTSRNQIDDLKQRQDNATARMASDSVGVFGTADPDFIGFVTDAFKQMKPVTVQSGKGSYGTIALLPEQQHATLEDRYYNAGTAFVMDRAGSAGVGQNILRSGPPPAGYYGGTKLMVQKRYKVNFRAEDDPTDFKGIYAVEVRREEAGYSLQAEERLDGDFYPGSIYRGLTPAYGWTFPKDDNGRMLYNPNPYSSAAWSGAPYTVPNNPATKPEVDSITPTSYRLGDPAPFFEVDGTNFTGAGFVMVGPFIPSSGGVAVDLDFDPLSPDGIYSIPPDLPGDTSHYPIPPGAISYRFIQDDSTIFFNPPSTLQPGTWDIIVVGADGQIGRLENALTITEAP